MEEELGEIIPCPQYTDDPGVRCGLPAEVQSSHWQHSTDGDMEVIAIQCIERHIYCGPRKFLTF
jgi:hypothetical protein